MDIQRLRDAAQELVGKAANPECSACLPDHIENALPDFTTLTLIYNTIRLSNASSNTVNTVNHLAPIHSSVWTDKIAGARGFTRGGAMSQEP